MGSLSERRSMFSQAVRQLPKVELEYRSPEWRAARRKRGWIVADAGGNISDFATVEGIASQTMTQWLKANDSELHGVLRDAPHPLTLPSEKRIERLIAVREGRRAGKRTIEIAAGMQLSTNRLNYWLRMWAPDGIDQAIEDESFEDEVAA